MKTELKNILRKLDKVEFRELELHLQLARHFREIIFEFKLTDDQVCERFKLTKKQLVEYRQGSHTFTLTDMAAIQARHVELEIEKVHKKVEVLHITSDKKENE